MANSRQISRVGAAVIGAVAAFMTTPAVGLADPTDSEAASAPRRIPISARPHRRRGSRHPATPRRRRSRIAPGQSVRQSCAFTAVRAQRRAP